MRLSALGLPRAPVPKKLLSSDDEEEELEGVETEQYLSHLSGRHCIQFICYL